MQAINKIVVLGHSGFIGGKLMATLRREHGSIEILGFSDPEVDLTDSGSAAILEPHLGASTALVICSGIKRQLGDTEQTFKTNIAIAKTVSELLANHPTKRVVFISSAAVYGEEIDSMSISEHTPVNPVSLYGKAKFESEKMLAEAVGKHPGNHLVMLRPPLVYGPGDKTRIYGPAGFAKAAAAGDEIVLWGDGTELREFLYCDDLCGLVSRLVMSDFDGVLNAASGQSRTFRESLDILGKLSGNPLKISQRPRSKSKVDNAFKIDKLKSAVPGFKFTELEQGLELTYGYELKNR